MTSDPECTEFGGSQKRPAIPLVERPNVRHPKPRSRRWQYFRRVDPRNAESLDNSTSQSISHISNADHGGTEQYTWSWVDLADEFTAENGDANRTPIDVGKRAIPISQNTTSGVELPDRGVSQAQCATTSHQSHSSPVAAEEDEGVVRDKTQRAKISTIRSLNVAMPRFKWGYPGANKQIVTANTAQSSSAQTREFEEHLYSQTRLRGEKAMIAPLCANDKQPEPADAMNAELDARELELERLRRDLSDSKALITELQKRLEAQSRDLGNSDSFFNTADKFSDSDVIKTLQKLNAEVQQSTTYMADCISGGFEFEDLATNSTQEQVSAAQRASLRLGSVLVRSLRTNTPDDIPMLLQIAFQAYFAFVLCQAISSWAFEPGYNKFIREIYLKLRSIEAQAIAGRWRSLTRAHNVPSWIAHPSSFIQGMLSDISDIMLAAGCTACRSDITTWITSKFKDKVSSLAELAGGLSKMLDEVVSCDFGVFISLPGKKFEDKTMEGADDDRAGNTERDEATVLCATHIGLAKRVPMGTLWERGKKEKIIALKAKVLLESFLNTNSELGD